MFIQKVARNNILLAVSGRDFEDFAKDLKIGQVLKGKVIEYLGQDKYVINLKGYNVVAESASNLDKGEVIQGAVLDTAPKVILKLFSQNIQVLADVDNEESVMNIIENCRLEPSLGEITARLKRILGNIVLKESNLNSDIKNFSETLNKSGLDLNSHEAARHELFNILSMEKFNQLEKEIVILKNLQKLFLEHGLSYSKYFILDELLNQLQKNIQAQRYINNILHNKYFFLYFQLPVFIDQVIQDCQLKFYAYKSKKDKKSGSRDKDSLKIAVLLLTDNMGKVRITMEIMGKKVSLSVLVKNEPVRAFIEGNLEKLKAVFEKLGFVLTGYKCRVEFPTTAQDEKYAMDFSQLNRLDTFV